MCIQLISKPFSFKLIKPIKTAKGVLNQKKGWLIRLQNQKGTKGWGEISPLNPAELKKCQKILNAIGNKPSREILEENLHKWPGPLAFGIGSGLAEIDGLIGENGYQDWLEVDSSAILLPDEESSLLETIDSVLNRHKEFKKQLTFKWKVATKSNQEELCLLKKILLRLPNNAKLRIDANGGWSRVQANEWANQLKSEHKLEWLEQPLSVNDFNGLKELNKKIPIALDESLINNPLLRKSWKGWQIRRPLIEGDPRKFLKELHQNNSYKVISTSFETGIARRWIKHLAALQLIGCTPKQPGLGQDWYPENQIFSKDPQLVWEAAS